MISLGSVHADVGRLAGGEQEGERDLKTLLDYRIAVALDPDTRQLDGKAEIRMSTGQGFDLLLSDAFAVERIELDETTLRLQADREGRLQRWRIPPGEPDRVLSVSWQGRLAERPAGMQHAQTLGWRDATASPDGSYLPASSFWYPVVAIDRTLPEVRYNARITLPAGQHAIMAGRLVEETEADQSIVAHYRFDQPAQGIDLITGPYQVEQDTYPSVDGRPITLRTLFHAEIAALSADYLASVGEYLALYETWIGPYPYDSFSVVSSPTPTGLGLPTMTYLGTRVLALPFIRATSLGHEVLHNWWGNGVFPDYARGNWSEGLTTFMADYHYAERSGEAQAREMRLGWLRELSAIAEGEDRPLASFTSRHHGVSQAVGYNKAAMLFLMLRDRIGEAAFDRGVRRFWSEQAFQTAGWDALQDAFAREAGEDLRRFFAQWLTRRDLPEIQLVAGTDRTLTIRQTGEPWSIDLPLQIDNADGSHTLRIRLEDERTTMDLSGYSLPLEVKLDPDSRTLRRLDRFEAPPILRELQFARTPQLVIIGPRALHDDAETLASRLLDDRPRPLSARRAPDPAEPLLVIGAQREIADWLARHDLPDTPELVAGQGDVRMWTQRLPSGAPLAVVAVDTPAALGQALRPLPHYRQQSWLVLKEGRALDRGTWPANVPTVRFEVAN